jgi:four helix bundle protein
MSFRFKEFRVYQEAKDYCKYSHDVVKKHFFERDRNLADQIERALISIVLNIAEGSGDHSDREFARFLTISMRSLYETVAGFDLAFHYGYIEASKDSEIEQRANTLIKQLASFRNRLKAK